MPLSTERIKCPRNPDHGMATKRWLPVEDRETTNPRKGAEVYEIDCESCGKFEYQDDPLPS